MRIVEGTWLWGGFSTEAKSNLSLIQKKVQDKLLSPKFDLHITLSGPYKSFDRYQKNVLKSFAKKRSSLILNTNDYSYSDNFYESFFISVEYSNELKKIREDIYNFFPFNINKNYKPHISLAYGDHSRTKKEELYCNIQKPSRDIIMDKIFLVYVNENIFQWEILEIFHLK